MALDPLAEALLKEVRQEIGYREKSGQHTKFGHWYADRVQDPQYRNAPWCDMFIAWAADRAGIADYVGQFAWTPSHAVWFIKQGAWSAEPEPGALVFFDWKGGKSYQGVDHVGIVERVDGKKIHTIEANVDRVWLKRKVREADKVVGYGLPRVVKANATLTEIRSTEQPLAPAPRAQASQGSPFDVLGSPLALLAVMVLTTVLLSLRFAGRRRGSHRRFSRPWNAPLRAAGAPHRLRTVPHRLGDVPHRSGDAPEPPSPRAPAGPRLPAQWPATRVAAPDWPGDRAGAPASRARVPAGAGHVPGPESTAARRRPYEPKP